MFVLTLNNPITISLHIFHTVLDTNLNVSSTFAFKRKIPKFIKIENDYFLIYHKWQKSNIA